MEIAIQNALEVKKKAVLLYGCVNLCVGGTHFIIKALVATTGIYNVCVILKVYTRTESRSTSPPEHISLLARDRLRQQLRYSLHVRYNSMNGNAVPF